MNVQMSLVTIQSQLEAIHPVLPALSIALAVFGAIYLLRRVAPRAWDRFAALGPNGSFGKIFQALPAVALGAALNAYLSGASPTAAAIGALSGALAPVLHELMRRYDGRGM